MAKKKAKIKAKSPSKRKVKPKEPLPPAPLQAYEYFVDEQSTDTVTQTMEDRANSLGSDGWQLLFIGLYGSHPNNIRIWYMRPKG